MVFDIKMENVIWKARFVADGHMTNAIATIMYSSIVSKETVNIALMNAVHNDLEVKSDNILNANVCGLLWVQSLVKMPENCNDCWSLIWSKVSWSSF